MKCCLIYSLHRSYVIFVNIALVTGHPEVGRLELSREVIFESVRVGFAAAYDLLVNHNPALRVSDLAPKPSCALSYVKAKLNYNSDR